MNICDRIKSQARPDTLEDIALRGTPVIVHLTHPLWPTLLYGAYAGRTNWKPGVHGPGHLLCRYDVVIGAWSAADDSYPQSAFVVGDVTLEQWEMLKAVKARQRDEVRALRARHQSEVDSLILGRLL